MHEFKNNVCVNLFLAWIKSVQFLPLCRVGITITSFFSIYLGRTRPALYKKKPEYMFEMNKIIFRPNLDMSSGVFGLPDKNKNESCQIFKRNL